MSRFLVARSRVKVSSALRALILIAAFSCASCTIRLIGEYDETIDQGVSDLQQHAELYFAKLKSNHNTPYDAGVYDDLNARLAVIQSRAASLPKYTNIATQVGNVRKQVGLLQKLDSITARPVPETLTDDAETALSVGVESVLKLELALKRGDKPS